MTLWSDEAALRRLCRTFHAYPHRKGAQASNSEYWYGREGGDLIVPQ
jgi:hypothetical protein